MEGAVVTDDPFDPALPQRGPSRTARTARRRSGEWPGGGSFRGRGPNPLAAIVLVLVVLVLVIGGLKVTLFKGSSPSSPGAPVSDGPTSKPPSGTTPPPTTAFEPAWVGPGPINPEFPALTTLRGNWERNFFGIGPVPQHPKVAWRVGPWCGESTDLGDTRTWCGTGWNGTPNVIPQPDGSVEVRIGGYDWAYHYLNGTTGDDTRKAFKTGDLAKGSATSDPDGCALHYVGSRDNQFRVLAVDHGKPRELWSMLAKSPSQGGKWNDDWDGAAQIVGDYLLEGGEDSWFRIIKLNRDCDGKTVRANPKVVFETPGWDGQLESDLQGNQDPADISIENSVAYDPARKVAYFSNGGGLVQGYDISKILNGGDQASRVFRYWMGGEGDASLVIADDGDVIASSHFVPGGNLHAKKSGQLIRLDPTKKGNPVVWKLKEDTMADGEAGFFATPALVGDTLFATATGGDFMAINAQNGDVYWKQHFTPPFWSGAAVVDGVAVFGDCSGRLFAYDVSDPQHPPKELWSMNLGGCIESTPAVWNGWIYVGTRSGMFYGISDKHLVKVRKQWQADHGPFPIPAGFEPPTDSPPAKPPATASPAPA